MGKKARGKRAEERKRQRQGAKAAQKALYAGFAAQGKLKGSRRQKRKVKATSPTKHAHLLANCGNPGCDRCLPLLAPNFVPRRTYHTNTAQASA